MAFGIDDALTSAAAGISLTDTIVSTIKKYRKRQLDYDFGQLIIAVQATTLKRIDEADLALTQFERMLVEKKVDLNLRLEDVVSNTPFWKPFEQHRMNQIQKRFNEFSDSIYSVGDDIAALARCRDQTYEMGSSVVETLSAKQSLHHSLLNAQSVKHSISILRNRLNDFKKALAA